MNTLLDNIIGTGVTLEDNYMWVYSYVTKSEDWLFVDGSYDREYVNEQQGIGIIFIDVANVYKLYPLQPFI